MEEKTENEKFLHIQELAKKGNAKAQNNLGCYYATDNDFVEVNIETAISWWERASKQGDGMAKVNLAMQYLQGAGVDADYDKAYDLLLAAVELIDKREEKAYAYLNLGTTAALLGYVNDQIRAYLQAAKYGDTRANLYLSLLLAPSSNEPKAEFWEKAKEENPLGVQVVEAISMSVGLLRGYPRDLEKAKELLLDAALKGNKQAAEKYFVLFGIQPDTTQEDVDTFLKILPYTSNYIAGRMYAALSGKYTCGINVPIDLEKAYNFAYEGFKCKNLAASSMVLSYYYDHYQSMDEETKKEADNMIREIWDVIKNDIDSLLSSEYLGLFLIYAECFRIGKYGLSPDYPLSRKLYGYSEICHLKTKEVFMNTSIGKQIKAKQSFKNRLIMYFGLYFQGKKIRNGLKQLNKLEKNGSK